VASWKKTFYIMWLAQFCSIMGFSFVLPFMPLYVRELGVSGDANVAWWAGLASSATGFSLMFFSPIWGHLADHYGRKPMVLRSMFGGAVVLALMGLSRNVTDLVILRAIQGALTGTVTATVALVASVVPAHRAGFALGMMQAAVFAGGSIGPLLGGEMWDRFGPQAPFLMAGAVLALGGLVVKFAVVEDFTRHPASEKHRRGSFREVFTAAGFLAAALVIFQIQFANMVRQPVFVLFIEELYGSGEAVARFVGGVMLQRTSSAVASRSTPVTTKGPRSPVWIARYPPVSGPRAIPRQRTEEVTPKALPRFCGDMTLVTIALTLGIMPATARPKTTCSPPSSQTLRARAWGRTASPARTVQKTSIRLWPQVSA